MNQTPCVADSELLDAATLYAQFGWPVFPCGHHKKPLIEGGFTNASTDPHDLVDWWARWPDAAIGVACGAAGLVVIDHDPRHDPDGSGQERLRLLCAHAPTRQARTGSGGTHYYYRALEGKTVRNSGGKLGPGLDVRGDGGYVIAPPSSNEDGGYRWINQTPIRPLPESVLDALAAEQPSAPAGPLPNGKIPYGLRNETMFRMASGMRAKGYSPLAIEQAALAQNRECEPPLDDAEVLVAVRSALRYEPGDLVDLSAPAETVPMAECVGADSVRVGVTLATAERASFVFTEMEKDRRSLDTHLSLMFAGAPEPYQQRVNLDSSTQRTELRRELDNLYGKDRGWAAALNSVWTLARQTYLQQDRSLSLREIPVLAGTRDLIPPLMPSEGTTILFGDGSSAKSYVALALALAGAVSHPMAGQFAVPRAPIMYIDYEDSDLNFRRRAGRVLAGLGKDPLSVDQLHYWRARGVPLTDQWEAIRRSCDRNGVGWIIVDSAAPACGGPPEEAASAIAYFRALERIGRPCLTIAHITKKGGDEATYKPFGCYSEDTEVLTDTGWKRHRQLTLDDRVLCFNLQTGGQEWHQPTGIHQYAYDGQMCHFQGGSKSPLDILVTPNHRMVVQPAYPLAERSVPRKNPRDWHFRTAEELGRTTWKMPHAALPDESGQGGDERFAAFIGWWLAEGTLDVHAPVLTQAEGPVALKMRETVAALGYGSNHWTGGRATEKPCMQLRLRGASKLGLWLEKECGRGSANKGIPQVSWTWGVAARWALFHALMEGDGSMALSKTGAARWRYTTTSPRLAGDMQRLAISLGLCARVVPVSRRGARWKDQYTVHIVQRTKVTVRAGRCVRRVPYLGTVWCLQVPTGAYVTRRNGCMAVAGNTAFWHNGARRTWWVHRVQEEESDLIQLALHCRKVNDGPKPKPVGLEITFEGDEGPVSIRPYDIGRSPELVQKTSAQNQLWAALITPMTVAQIAEATDLAEPVVKTMLNRHGDRFAKCGEMTTAKNQHAALWARRAHDGGQERF